MDAAQKAYCCSCTEWESEICLRFRDLAFRDPNGGAVEQLPLSEPDELAMASLNRDAIGQRSNVERDCGA